MTTRGGWLADPRALHPVPLAAVVERLGMIPFEVVPGLLGPMTRYRRTR